MMASTPLISTYSIIQAIHGALGRFGNCNYDPKQLTSVRNRGELAEGWYEPTTLQKARASATSAKHLAASPSYKHESFNQGYDNDNDDVDDTNDAVGPALPAEGLTSLDVGRRSGPAIPNFQDLELHRGTLDSI